MEDEGNNTNADPFGTEKPPGETERPVSILTGLLGLFCALIGAGIGMQMGLEAGEHPPLFSLCFGFLLGGFGGASVGSLVEFGTRKSIILIVVFLVVLGLAWDFYYK